MDLEPIVRLTRDLKDAAKTLGRDEARYLVDAYYMMQRDRIRADHQVRSLAEGAEPHSVLAWFGSQSATMENQIRRALDAYSDAHAVGEWSKSIMGIGPVIAAGLIAHIDIAKAPTVGHIWRFAGLDPSVAWNRSEKRPWNASLKTLTWKIGESFVKVSGHDEDVYGHVYVQRKAEETAKNERGLFAEQARAKLERFKIGKDTDAYKAYSHGRLPPAHLHARAKRYAVKLFLSHWHHVAYEAQFKTAPPKPYILTPEGGHAHYMPPPHWP
jgi:hypothetical protein